VRDLWCLADESVQHSFRPALTQPADNVNDAHNVQLAGLQANGILRCSMRRERNNLPSGLDASKIML
jgi:hypothetical protein